MSQNKQPPSPLPRAQEYNKREAALRDNLLKRKQQTRARQTTETKKEQE